MCRSVSDLLICEMNHRKNSEEKNDSSDGLKMAVLPPSPENAIRKLIQTVAGSSGCPTGEASALDTFYCLFLIRLH